MYRQKIMSICMLFLLLLPAKAQQTEIAHRYQIAVCDWTMLKYQKTGEFQLVKELGGDGVEMDMGSLGTRDTFDNKLRQPHFQKLFKETAEEYRIKVPSVAMSGFFGQSVLTHTNYKALVQHCLNTMHVMGANVAFLPLGGIKENWQEPAEGVVIGTRTPLDAKGDIKLLKEIFQK